MMYQKIPRYSSVVTWRTICRGRVVWITGNLDFSANRSNWDIDADITKSPMWQYSGKNAQLYKCPADTTTVNVGGLSRPRVRSISMAQTFSVGEWLDKSYNEQQNKWRVYNKLSTISNPVKTFVFVEEHPGSINDAAFANACTGNQPGDAQGAAQIIDMPGSLHAGACGFSFSDGHAEIHKWKGRTIQPVFKQNQQVSLNIPTKFQLDTHWLASIPVKRSANESIWVYLGRLAALEKVPHFSESSFTALRSVQ
jgi:hypothetical protein